MTRRAQLTALIVLATASTPNLQADDTASLSQNPFSRPPSAVKVVPRKTRTEDGSIQVINLQATMVAANNGLANVDGRILRPGEDVEGYTLLQVFEDRAIFSRDGKRLTVFVKPELVDDDD